MFELATNSTVTVTSVDPHLVYATYALVIVSVGAVVVAALQNRKTQKLMAEQSIVMGKQVDQAIAQTRTRTLGIMISVAFWFSVISNSNTKNWLAR